MKRKIAVLTGSRAEYGILRPLIKLISSNDNLALILIVTGLHLLEKFDCTINRIKEDNYVISAIVEMYDATDNKKEYYGQALSRVISGLTEVLVEQEPDIVVVLGDRLEPFAAAVSAATLNIPIAHIHGGDKTDSGHIDESLRHSITRFAHLHFPATENHKQRLERMGEESWRIFSVGSMGLDTIVKKDTISKEQLSEKLDFKIDDKTVLAIFHPVHHEEDIGLQMREILNSLQHLNLKTIILYPNNDPGSEKIIDEIERVRDITQFKILRNLSHDDYIDVLRNVSVMIGNSSSGIIEAASVGLPVVNIGSRNKGRGTSKNILYVESDSEQIVAAINKSLYDVEFLALVRKIDNPFGDGRTAERILDILENTEIDANLLTKRITY